MKKRKIITIITFIMILFGVVFSPQNYSKDAAMEVYAASASSGATKLDPGVITYNSFRDESRQIPCESRGGIYFLNDNELTFYSLSTKKATLVYTFDTERAVYKDTYVDDNNKLYVLEYLYYTGQSLITVYDLEKQKVEKTIVVDVVATIIGADYSGRFFLIGQEDSDYVIYLVSPSGQILSKIVSQEEIFDFVAYDKTNGNFYFEAYYNLDVYNSDHNMHALRMGRVSGNNMQIKEAPILVISQTFFSERQRPVDLLGSKYLCIDSTYQAGLFVLDSNIINLTTTSMHGIYRNREQRNLAGNFENRGAVGSRTVYLKETNSIVTFIDNKTLAEVDLSTEKEIAKVTTTYPVFSLMKYNDSVIAIEKNGNDFYLEIFPWKKATYVKITASSNTMSIGNTMQLKTISDSTISETYNWTTNNNKVVSITDSGEVTAWSEGTAVITVTSSQGLKGTYTITVGSGLSVQDPKKSSIVTKGTVSSNISKNNYSVYGKVMNSYLAQNTDGTLTRVEYINNQVIVETYSADGATLKSTKKITPELNKFGGFYSGSSYNYMVFGQSNFSEDDNIEVMRVVKYSKDWKRISSVSIKGANTYNPFDSGSLRMTEANDKLYIHTCHTMYERGGYNHQANMTFVIDENTMVVNQSNYIVMNIAQTGYVSHSFNQFVQADDKYLYRVDHGDAYPRGITIIRCDLSGKITDVSYTIPIDLLKVDGDNDTGASVGGFELSSTNCIIAGNAVDYTKSNADSHGNRNIFVSVTDKNLNKTEVVWLTKYSESQNIRVYTPQLTKLGNNKFLIMWEEYYSNSQKTYTRMATIDDRGNLTSDVTYADVRLSDCHPILCKDGLVRWYTTNNSSPTIYAVNPYHLSHIQTGTLFIHDTPKLTSVSNINGGVQISWGKVTGAAKYRVFYRTSANSSWTKIADTTATSYTWKGTTSGTKYTFTVRCISSDGKSYTSDYDRTGKSITYNSMPKVTSVGNVNGGVQINWDKVTGAAKYRVFYKTSANSSWTKIADTTATSYTWTGAKSGTKYTFTVRCISSDGKSYTSAFDSTGKSVTYIAAPKISSVSNMNGGVQISWGKVAGAAKYRVFYRTSANSSWTKVADTTATSYTWTGAKSGMKYTFTVRCLNSKGTSYTSSYDSTGKSIKYVAVPKLGSVSNTATGVKITWGAVTGAEKYRVFYKIGNGSWTKVADTTATSYTWTGAKSGTKYTFTVRCLNSAGTSYTSSYDSTGKSIKYIAAPKLGSVSNTATGVKITWGTVTGAEKYRVFYKIGNGSWTKVADTTSTSYTWTGAKSGTKYTFTVRCLNSKGTSYTSSYDSTGKSIMYLSEPKISKIEADNSGVKITWGKVAGATTYRVYYMSANGWYMLKETSDTSVTLNAVKGNTYKYTVKALNGSTASSYHSGTSFKRLENPVLSSVSNTSNGVKLNWEAVNGAAMYRVYYKTGNGSWTKIADTTSTSYTWAGAKSGTTYTFTVRCLSSDGTVFTSGCDATGKKITYIGK